MSKTKKDRLKQSTRGRRPLVGSHSEEDRAALTLKQEVRAILTSGLRFPENEDALAVAIRKALNHIGQFYRTENGMPLFFRNRNHRLYDVLGRADSEFGRLVTYLCDVSSRMVKITRCLDRIQAEVCQMADTVTVHALAYNSDDGRIIAVNDFGGGMWYRERGGQWAWKPNGSEGILFWAPPDFVEPWKPQFSGNSEADEAALEWFLDLPHFDENTLTEKDQRMLLRATLIAPLFPCRNRTKPVAVHLGSRQQRQYDTGKTMAAKIIGTLWVGRKFEPVPVKRSSERGEEELQLTLMNQPYVLLDNVDTAIPWLNDFLCTYATGARPTRRKHYENTTLVYYEYRGRLCLTSRDPKFNREDVASRTIPFRFKPLSPEERKTEWELLNPVAEKRNQIWAGILTIAAKVQDALPHLAPPALRGRLADFLAFGWCVGAACKEETQWEGMADRLALAQAGFAVDEAPIFSILTSIVRRGDVDEQPTSEFWKAIKTTGEAINVEPPRDAASCTKQVRELRELIQLSLDVTITMRTLHGQTLIQITRGPSWALQEGVSEVTESEAFLEGDEKLVESNKESTQSPSPRSPS